MGKIAVLYGSSRPSNVGETVAKWFTEKVDIGEHTFELIDIASLNLPIVPEEISPMYTQDRAYVTPEIKAWSDRVIGYDAFVFVVAEYNLGYTPLLKNAVDVLYHEWVEKPMAFVSYGAYDVSTAVSQLRTVTEAFRAKLPEANVHVAQAYEAVTPEGVNEEKVDGDAQAVADQLIALI